MAEGKARTMQIVDEFIEVCQLWVQSQQEV